MEFNKVSGIIKNNSKLPNTSFGNFYGRHRVVFITKQSALILWNITHVYFNSYFSFTLCYMFRPVLRPSSSKSIQKPYTGRYNKNIRGPCYTGLYFDNVKT